MSAPARNSRAGLLIGGVIALIVIAVAAIGFFVVQLEARQRAVKEQLHAITAQLERATAEFAIAERPWVSPRDAGLETAISIDDVGVHGVFDMTVENSGRSPAVHIWIDHETLIADGATNPAAEQRRLCDARRKKPIGADGSGAILFPGARYDQSIPLNVAKADLDKAVARLQKREAADFSIHLVGCIDYAFSFAEGHHQTPFDYEFDKSTGSGPFDFVHFTIGDRRTAPGAIKIRTNPMTGTDAN